MATPDAHQTGIVFSIQKYSVHDGPGIRTLIFLKGCSLRCNWCSNPESQLPQAQLACNSAKCLTMEACKRCLNVCNNAALGFDEAGRVIHMPQQCVYCFKCAANCPTHALNVYGYEITVEKALQRVEEDDLFYARSGGGVTLSGGEPLFQDRFAIALLTEARRRRLNTCVETCGNVAWPVMRAAVKHLNSMLLDIKCIDEVTHIKGTGVSNRRILANLKQLKKTFPELPLTIRTPVIPGFNDNNEEIRAIAELVAPLPNTRYEILGYHRMGTPKYTYLGREYPLADVPNLSEERLAQLQKLVREVMEKKQ